MAILEAGGIVFWDGNVVLRRNRKGHWLFPKGHIEGEESLEEAALREVREELGLEARILGKAGMVRFSYGGDDYEVHFFVMEVIRLLPEWSAHRGVDAFVLPPKEALGKLSFTDYRKLLERVVGVKGAQINPD